MGRTNEKLWEESKKKAIAMMGGNASRFVEPLGSGKWSARTAQLAGLYYRQSGARGIYSNKNTGAKRFN